MAEDKRPMNKQMAEAMILAKLYKDGFFIVDEETKTVAVEMRRGEIIKRYEESSYDDIRNIVERTVKGLEQAGYMVSVRWLDGASMDSQDTLEAITRALEKPGVDLDLKDGFGDTSKN